MTLTCTSCGTPHFPHEIQTVCSQCGQPLRADYFFSPEQLDPTEHLEDHPTLWRYQAFLPSITRNFRISLGEGQTPLLERIFKGVRIYFKDESSNPTGSFKDRGMCVALTMARALGIQKIALPSAGNAAVSASAYALAGNLRCRVFLPTGIPDNLAQEVSDNGAEVVLAGSTIAEAGQRMAAAMDDSWFDVSTLKEPYRVEGKKTLGLEIAEQLGWAFPDYVIYPTGGGTGLLGIWKAFKELRRLGWVNQDLPEMIAVQTNGCAPVVAAFNNHLAETSPWLNPKTRALGLNVPSPLGGRWMLSVLGESRGAALAVAEDEIDAARVRLNKVAGSQAGPEAAVAWRGLELLVERGLIGEGKRAVVLITGDDRRYS